MKFLHTSITVKNMDATIAFYTKHLGLKLLRRREIPENNAEVAFLTDEAHSTELELTYWRDKKSYEEGDQLDHLAFEVEDLDTTIKKMKNEGVEVAKEPYMLKGGSRRLAFIKDPNGIWIELIEKG
ncbi:MAG: VOC family protein [Nitrososphaerales archaeon]